MDADIVYLNGYGFPAWRDGPLFYPNIVAYDCRAHQDFDALHGSDLWSPAPLPKRLAREG